MNLPTSFSALARSLALSVASILLLQSCGSRESRNRPVSEDAALPVVRALVASVGAGNREYFNEKLDSSAFTDRVTRGMGLSVVERMAAQLGMFNNLDIGDFIVNDISGGSYTFLRLHTVDGETHALVRAITPTGELNYHDIVLGYRRGTNEVAIRDVFVYGTGDPISRIFGSLVESILAAEEKDVDEGEGLVAMLDSMTQLAKQEEFDKVISLYRSLPAADRARKITLWVYLTYTSIGGLAYYKNAIDEYLTHHPRDTGAALLRLRKAVLNENNGEAIGAIDALNKIVGGDPYLDHLRGSYMIAMGDTAGGAALLKKAVAAEPEFAAIYWSYLDLLVEQGRHAEARDLLVQLERKGGIEREEIGGTLLDRSSSAYMRFRRSREYVGWERSPESGVRSRESGKKGSVVDSR